jgi:hypothetical protein
MPYYKKEYRNTKAGGKTINIAVCPKCLTIIEPCRVERGKYGTHGFDYYEHEHDLDFLELRESNSGKRNFTASGKLLMFYNDIFRAWIIRGLSIEEIKEYLEKELQKLRAKSL